MESPEAEGEAATKIQSAWKGRKARQEVKMMQRWELKYLVALEGGKATALAIALVVADLTLSIGYADKYPGVQEPFGFFVTFFFVFELSLRFYCYSALNKTKGCDWSDCNFFTQDYTRLVDLITVILDLLSIFILLLASSGGSVSSLLRTG